MTSGTELLSVDASGSSALIRTGRGHYALNPAVAWSGTLASREQAAQRSGLRLVDEAV